MSDIEVILRLLLLGMGRNKESYRRYVALDLVNNQMIRDTKTKPKA